MRNILLVLLTPAIALLFAACGSEPVKSPDQVKPVQVEVQTARTEAVAAVLEAPGTVLARERIVLSSQINGFVREVRVRAGDLVKAGQVLLTLDARDAENQQAASQAAIEEAQAALDEARKGARIAQSMRDAAKSSADLAEGTYARYQKLFQAHSVSAQEIDEVRARRDAAASDLAAKEIMVSAAQDKLRQVEARISQAQAQSRRSDVYVGWTVIAAPSAGRIVERSIDPGSAIFPGNPLITLESTTKPQVLASLPTADARNLRSGLEVQVLIPDQSQTPVGGQISDIIPVSGAGSLSIQFKVDLPPAFAALSGSFVKVRIPAGSREALLLPMQVLRTNGQLTGVLIADSSAKARFRLVKTAPFDAERVEVLAGLEPGERIVAKPGDQIVDGTSLEIRQ
jgi:multidrug efflux pump subunit AcrA (membrane-fusion protein)